MAPKAQTVEEKDILDLIKIKNCIKIHYHENEKTTHRMEYLKQIINTQNI